MDCTYSNIHTREHPSYTLENIQPLNALPEEAWPMKQPHAMMLGICSSVINTLLAAFCLHPRNRLPKSHWATVCCTVLLSLDTDKTRLPSEEIIITALLQYPTLNLVL